MERAMGKKDLSRQELTEEIERLRELLKKYNDGEQMPSDFKYREVLWTLEHMRNKMRCLKKREKKDG